MLTPPTTSTSVSSLVTISSSQPQQTPSPSTNSNPVPAGCPQDPVKTERKKARKTNPGILQSPRKLALEETGCSVVFDDSSGSGKRKRSRKQTIATISEDTLNSFTENSVTAPKRKRAKKANTVSSSKSAPSVTSSQSGASPTESESVGNSASVHNQNIQRSVFEHDLHQEREVNIAGLIDPKLSFTIFPDLSRKLAAIGPSQVIISVDTTRELASRRDIESNGLTDDVTQYKTFLDYLTVPHFLPLTSVYSSGEPFSRVLRFSELQEYTDRKVCKNHVGTFRFGGSRYEKQISHTSEKNNKTVSVKENKNGYRRADFVIKHPTLGYYHRKVVCLKFPVLKSNNNNEITTSDTKGNAVVKAKIVQLRRSADLKNIEIYVDESIIRETASDVYAMNHQNIQPVIQTPTGLLPIVTRSPYLQQQQQIQQSVNQEQYQYNIQCFPPTFLVEESASSNYFSIADDATLSGHVFTNDSGFCRGDILGDNETQVVFLNSSVPSSSGHVQFSQADQVLQHENNLYNVNEQCIFPIEAYHQQQQHSLTIQQDQPLLHYPLQSQQPTPSHPPESKVIGHVYLNPDSGKHEYRFYPHPQGDTDRIILRDSLGQGAPLQLGQQNQLNQHNYQPSQVLNPNQILLQPGSNCPPTQRQAIEYSISQEAVRPSISNVPKLPEPRFQVQALQQQLLHNTSQQTVTSPFSAAAAQISHKLVVQPQVPEPPPAPVVNTVSSTTPKQKPKGTRKPKQKVSGGKNNVNELLANQSNQTSLVPIIPHSQQQQLLLQHQQPHTLSPFSVKSNNPVQSSSSSTDKSPSSTSTGHQQTPLIVKAVSLHSSSSSSPRPPQSVVQVVVTKGTSSNCKTPLVRLTTPQASVSSAARPQSASAPSTSSPSATPQITKTLQVISPRLATSTPVLAVIESAAAAPSRRIRKPGFVAVCPHCGVCSSTLDHCGRCKTALPADVKVVKDGGGWEVNKTSAAVLQVVQQSPAAGSSVPSDKVVEPVKDNCRKIIVTPGKAPTKVATKKIVIVNKPPLYNNLSTSKPTAGTVQIQIQKDGGSSVTIVNNNNNNNTPVANKPAPKRRAPPRRKQQECITLSSDDEEPNVKPSSPQKSSAVQETGGNSGVKVGSMTNLNQSTVQENTQSIVATPPNTAMEKRKRMSINLTPDGGGGGPQKVEDESCETPEKVLTQITDAVDQPGGKVQFVQIECRSVRVGSYKVTSADLGFSIPVTVTDLGIKFSIPSASSKHRQIQMCIPMKVILQTKGHFNKRLPVLIITTGPKYAKWVRDTLELHGNPSQESSNYYCPVNGSTCQKAITFVAESIEDADVGIIRNVLKTTLEEMTYNDANKFLMEVTPQSYRSSISYNTPDSSAVSSPSNASARTESVSSSSGSRKQVNSQTRPSENSTISSTSSTSTNVNIDPEGVILLYEGGNNVKVPICPKDISCLGYSQFLNDQIIDFWLAVIQTELLSDDDKKRTHVFDTFFYSKLTEKVKKRTPEEGTMTAAERRHARVKKRTKNVDIFSKDFLIVPINENYHWFIAIICFPGLQGYHDYESLQAIPDYKRPRAQPKSKGAASAVVVSNQPQSESTASYSNRDEAPEDPDEVAEISENTSAELNSSSQSKSQTSDSNSGPSDSGSRKRKPDFGQRVKHPCILIFDSLVGDARGRIYSTLREYLKVEYKTKKNADRVFDKNAMPGCMPKVPQQPNFSDCGLFMLQYVESFFSRPIQNYDVNSINLKSWFEPSIAENKRREIYSFVTKKVQERVPSNLSRIPQVNFEPTEDDMNHDQQMHDEMEDDDDDDEDDEDYFEEVTRKKEREKNDSDDHNYAKDVKVVVAPQPHGSGSAASGTKKTETE